MIKRLAVSFSGGRTSGRMAHLIKSRQICTAYDETIFVFANTGEEEERTLVFADRCDREWGLNLIWLEAVVAPERGTGTTFRRVTFETAARAGEPFAGVIEKYGLPGPSFPHCTRELKEVPIVSYLRSLGWRPGSYHMAVGLRADETDRQAKKAKQAGIIYPLMGLGIRKADVVAWWKQQLFDLYLPEHLGNCKWCWKKTMRKHLTLAVDHPEVFTFPAEMEWLHSDTGPGGRRQMFRKHLMVADIFERAKHPFEKFVDGNEAFDPDLDVGGACGDSCEVFSDES